MLIKTERNSIRAFVNFFEIFNFSEIRPVENYYMKYLIINDV